MPNLVYHLLHGLRTTPANKDFIRNFFNSVLLNKLSCLFGIFIYWNYWWKMTYWVLITIHHLRWFLVQQLGGEVLHFSLHLWTAMNTSFGFLCFAWIRHIFTWNCHLSPDLNYEQWINTTSFIHGQQLTLFLFMFCIDPTKISTYFNISRIWLLK